MSMGSAINFMVDCHDPGSSFHETSTDVHYDDSLSNAATGSSVAREVACLDKSKFNLAQHVLKVRRK